MTVPRTKIDIFLIYIFTEKVWLVHVDLLSMLHGHFTCQCGHLMCLTLENTYCKLWASFVILKKPGMCFNRRSPNFFGWFHDSVYGMLINYIVIIHEKIQFINILEFRNIPLEFSYAHISLCSSVLEFVICRSPCLHFRVCATQFPSAVVILWWWWWINLFIFSGQ